MCSGAFDDREVLVLVAEPANMTGRAIHTDHPHRARAGGALSRFDGGYGREHIWGSADRQADWQSHLLKSRYIERLWVGDQAKPLGASRNGLPVFTLVKAMSQSRGKISLPSAR